MKNKCDQNKNSEASLFLLQVLEKAHMQFQSFLDDHVYKEEHGMHVEVIRTLGRIGPNTEPRFRDECKLLPH